ncbi:hypothetical protein [Xanthomonas sacchari]|uniref:hypothetical protein n=1 Tax=Xanthomonas sacchari TaxID=56458 RepID=UPI00225E0BF3|nr:hypothetical protein [Xanthomonas sacchari]
MSAPAAVLAAKLAGRCANGLERGQGSNLHAIPSSQVRRQGGFTEAAGKALCGAEPGRRSVGWTVCEQQPVSCPRCLRALERVGAMSTTALVVPFNDTGDFAALRAAEAWCRDRGVSYGSQQRGSPIGLLVGDYAIAKWRNLSTAERAALHGTITGDTRTGPVVLRIRISALRAAGIEVSEGSDAAAGGAQ